MPAKALRPTGETGWSTAHRSPSDGAVRVAQGINVPMQRGLHAEIGVRKRKTMSWVPPQGNTAVVKAARAAAGRRQHVPSMQPAHQQRLMVGRRLLSLPLPPARLPQLRDEARAGCRLRRPLALVVGAHLAGNSRDSRKPTEPRALGRRLLRLERLPQRVNISRHWGERPAGCRLAGTGTATLLELFAGKARNARMGRQSAAGSTRQLCEENGIKSRHGGALAHRTAARARNLAQPAAMGDLYDNQASKLRFEAYSRLQAAAVAFGENLPVPEIVAIGGQVRCCGLRAAAGGGQAACRRRPAPPRTTRLPAMLNRAGPGSRNCPPLLACSLMARAACWRPSSGWVYWC